MLKTQNDNQAQFENEPNTSTNYDKLRKGGEKFSKEMLAKGWNAECIIEFPRTISILVLRHNNNSQAAWYFNHNNDFIGNKLSQVILTKEVINRLICSVFNHLIKVITKKNLDTTLLQIINEKSYIYSEFSSLTSFALGVNKQDLLAKNYQDYFYALDEEGRDIQDGYILSSNKDNIVEIVISNKSYKTKHAVVLNNFTLCYFLENTTSDNIILFESGHYSSRFALVDCANTVLCQSPKTGCPSNLNVPLKLLLEHIANYSEILTKYFSTPCTDKIGMIRNSHLGHSLWNDLSGLYRIKTKKIEKKLSEIVVFGGKACEPWINIENVLPKMAINRKISNQDMLANYIYNNHLFTIRVSDNYITSTLSNDLISFYQKFCPEKTSKLSNELRVVIGLRFENRTWINQVDGIIEIASYLSTKTRKLSLVIDGHDLINSTGKIQFSHHEPIDNHLTILEKSVVDELRASLNIKNVKNVKVIDAVGMRLDCSVKWINSADFFIAPWGAGLAKYKWISNLPGIIFTSQWNLNNKPDLKIYESTSFREGATPCLYVAPEYIEDRDCSTNNIKVPDMPEHPSRADFIVDIKGINKAIDELLFQIGKAP